MAQEEKKAREVAEKEACSRAYKARMDRERVADMGVQGETGARSDAGDTKEEEKGEDNGITVSLSLKKLMKECLGKDVQTGKKGHDSLEDAIAARDLVHWQITQPKHG
jgi:RNA exonuclease 1